MTQNLQGPSTTTYEPNSERVSRVVTGSLDPLVSAETSYVTYAYNGAVSQDLRRTAYGPGMASRQLKVIVNAYDAERRLTSSYFLLDSTPHPRLPYVAYSRMERYRYDPLGRRVWREMIRDTLNLICKAQDKASGCRNEVTRTVWDGDQVL